MTSTPELDQAYQLCEARARGRLENFPVLSEYIAREHARHLAAVYAFCRIADDAADESANAEEALTKLGELRAEIDRAYGEGAPKAPEMLALQDTIRARSLTRRHFEDLLDAFCQDQRKTRYRDWAELEGYAKRSADPVGRLVLETLGETSASSQDPDKLRRSDLICTGLQFANFWQDVDSDFAKGRIYIPADAMARHGVTEEHLTRRVATPEFCQLLADLCSRTAPMFAEGARLADSVQKRLRIPILAFAIAGHELLGRIRDARYDVFTRRPEIGELPAKKILAKAAAARWIPAFRP